MMTEKFILEIPSPRIDKTQLLKVLHMDYDETDEDVRRVLSMLEEALSVARPKAVYGVAPIEEKGDDYIVAGGVRIPSLLVRRNVEKVGRIFPFVATCGREVEEWSQGFTDFLEQYWADAIKMLLLSQIRTKLTDTVKQTYVPDANLSAMSPGSLKEWPLPQQAVLFNLIGSVTEDTGVTLTDSFLMLPSKSSSGFFFSNDGNYENCQLCPILDCPGRRAPYQPDSVKL